MLNYVQYIQCAINPIVTSYRVCSTNIAALEMCRRPTYVYAYCMRPSSTLQAAHPYFAHHQMSCVVSCVLSRTR